MARTLWPSAPARIRVTVDARTARMMDEVRRIVGRSISRRILPAQGSYHNGSLSGGTHCGGGAIDLDIDQLTTAEILALVRAMRRVGFAAWWRRRPEWTQGQHVHAIAVGCPDLNPAAEHQVTALRHGLNGLANHGADRHADMHLPVTTWEAYQRKKAKSRAAAVVVVAVGTAAGGVAVAPGTHHAPKPKPPVVAKPHPKAKTPRVTRLSAKVHPGAHAAQVRDVRAVLVHDGFGPIGEKPADWYGPVTRAAVHHFLAAHPQFGPANDKLGPRGWRWLQTKAGRKP